MSDNMADNAESICPHRKYMDDPEIKWREGKPDYTKINKLFLEGRSRVHKEGSLEKIVEDLVKTWEMEATHKTRLEVSTFSLYTKPLIAQAMANNIRASADCYAASQYCPGFPVQVFVLNSLAN